MITTNNCVFFLSSMVMATPVPPAYLVCLPLRLQGINVSFYVQQMFAFKFVALLLRKHTLCVLFGSFQESIRRW